MPPTREFDNTPSRDSVIAENKRKLAEGATLSALGTAAYNKYPQYFASATEAENAIIRKQPSSTNPIAN